MFYLYYLNIIVFRILDVIYQRREAKFYHISKQRKENWKYDGKRNISNLFQISTCLEMWF